MAEYIQIFTTTESRDDAEMISRKVVEKRLAACVQVLGPITSTYWWQDEIETAEEWQCVIKSRQTLYEALEEAILQAHPYDVPEILAIPVTAGYKGYLKWLDGELRK